MVKLANVETAAQKKATRAAYGATLAELEMCIRDRGCAAKGAGCDGAGWCGTALDGTTGRNRAQPGAEGGLAALQTL